MKRFKNKSMSSCTLREPPLALETGHVTLIIKKRIQLLSYIYRVISTGSLHCHLTVSLRDIMFTWLTKLEFSYYLFYMKKIQDRKC